MKELRITRNFLKNPINSVLILLSIVLLIEALSWSIGYNIKVDKMHNAGGFLQYVFTLVRAFVIPEFFTLFITIYIINRFHDWFHISTVKNSWRAVGRYELHFLPVLMSVFWVFDLITQTVRYLLTDFSSYSLHEYWQEYIVDTYTFSTYFKYLFPVIFIGYLAINLSLLKDYLKQRREAQEQAEAEAVESAKKAEELSAALTAPRLASSSSCLSFLKGRDAVGELDFPIGDVYYFTIEDRFYYAELAKGRYAVPKTLNELEAELDPTQFFRIKRDYIVNRQAVQNYAYWENGKYTVRLNTPVPYDIIVPRARMQEFREWLQSAGSYPLETSS